MSWLEEARSRSTLRPFAVAPLARRLGLEAADTAALALRLGLNRGTVKRYRALGLTLGQADEWAYRVDLHPGSVWVHWGRVDLRGVSLVAAGRESCPAGHALVRVDSEGARRCEPCPRAAAKRYRERKLLLAAPMTRDGTRRAPVIWLGDGMAQRERVTAYVTSEVSARLAGLAGAAGISTSAYAASILTAALSPVVGESGNPARALVVSTGLVAPAAGEQVAS